MASRGREGKVWHQGGGRGRCGIEGEGGEGVASRGREGKVWHRGEG